MQRTSLICIGFIGLVLGAAVVACSSDDSSPGTGGTGQSGQGGSVNHSDAGTGGVSGNGGAGSGGVSGQGGSAGGQGGSSGGQGGSAGGQGGSSGGQGGSAGAPSIVLPAGCGPDGIKQQCSPITNEGCNTGAGEACDFGNDDSHFECFPGPNNAVPIGGDCSYGLDLLCIGTAFCDMTSGSEKGVCRKFCCSSDDCPKEGMTCKPASEQLLGTLGVCY